MKRLRLKTTKFNLGSLAKKKSEELSKIPMTKLLYLSVLVLILTLVLTIFTQENLPPEIPLFYGLAEGEEQLASAISLVIPPVVSTGVVMLNAFILLKLKNELMQKSLVVTSFAVTIFSLVTTVKILLLVGSF